jgi:predicted transcriptional regulator
MPQKRSPGGGRKPRGEFRGNSKILTVRVRPELRTTLERLAKKHRRSLSQEMQRGLDAWVGRYNDPKLHVGALAHAITLLVEAIERATGKRWHEDAFTGEALRHAVEALIFYFAPTPDGKPVSVPAPVEEAAMRMPPGMRDRARTAADVGTAQAGMLITLIQNAPVSDKPPFGLAFPDEQGLWQILRDLGSGWKRNRAAWLPKETRK